MKILDKIALVLFSNIILIISIIACVIIFGWVDIQTIDIVIKAILNDNLTSNIILVAAVLLILLSIRCIFFDSSSKDKKEDKGILMENENGRLVVSNETIQNLVNGVVKKFESAQDITTKVMLEQDKSVSIEVTLFVSEEAIIKDLSNDLQLKIKEVIKQTLDLEVKKVNIKVKNIAPNKEVIEK